MRELINKFKTSVTMMAQNNLPQKRTSTTADSFDSKNTFRLSITKQDQCYSKNKLQTIKDQHFNAWLLAQEVQFIQTEIHSLCTSFTVDITNKLLYVKLWLSRLFHKLYSLLYNSTCEDPGSMDMSEHPETMPQPTAPVPPKKALKPEARTLRQKPTASWPP